MVSTTMGGYALSGGDLSDIPTITGLLVGTGLCATSAFTWNMILEKDNDARMNRTAQRPLCKKTVTIPEATVFGCVHYPYSLR